MNAAQKAWATRRAAAALQPVASIESSQQPQPDAHIRTWAAQILAIPQFMIAARPALALAYLKAHRILH